MSQENETRSFPNESITSDQFEILKSSLIGNIGSLMYISRNLIVNEKQNIKGEEMSFPQLEVINIVTSLYIHALEEFGKFLFVDELERNKKQKYDLFRIRGDFFSHSNKLNKAMKNIPSECYDLGFDFEKEIVTTTLDTRLDIFHAGMHENGDIRKFPLISFDKLDKAVKKFSEEFEKIESSPYPS